MINWVLLADYYLIRSPFPSPYRRAGGNTRSFESYSNIPMNTTAAWDLIFDPLCSHRKSRVCDVRITNITLQELVTTNDYFTGELYIYFEMASAQASLGQIQLPLAVKG